MGASGPGSYGQWELCSNGTVVIGIKEKVYQDGASALNGVKLRCSNYIDVISAEGKDGEYSNVFLYCNLGFSHARLAIRVGQSLGPIIIPGLSMRVSLVPAGCFLLEES